MGLLFTSSSQTGVTPKNRPSDELLHKLSCRACPLNKAEHIQSPKMPPSGSQNPLIYFLAEAPGEIEDEENKQLVGPSGDLLWPLIPPKIKVKSRRNNVLNCRPQNNRNPEDVEIECCRPRIVEDIEKTKPAVIFGLGAVPLAWANMPGGIKLWRGRRFPIKVGSHTCWYYPMRHPAFR